jgi:hypothetical protein
MNVTSVTATNVRPMTMSGASRVGGPGSADRMQGALSATANLFGMSTDQLVSAVQGGRSLSSLAASKGVSQSDLLNAIKQGIQNATPQGASGPSASQLDTIASRIANHTGGRVHHHHHGHGGQAASAVNGATSTSGSTSTSSSDGTSGFSALA